MALQSNANNFLVSKYIQNSRDLYKYLYYFGAANAAFADQKDT
jgi:hypothetical protein